ncbi:type II secretion system F family protein [candidate division WOR-3 bacterium]|nr:type II secretion system F family protein [candidate division WOR-3 bacterium]
MINFKYKGRNKEGKIIESKIEAKNIDEAKSMLKAQGLQIISINRDWASMEIKFGSGVGVKDVTLFTRQFATMISAGLPLLQCLKILQDQTLNKSFKTVLKQIISEVEGGSTLAEAMKKQKGVFTTLYTNMVQAGEEGGALDTILGRLAGFMEKTEALNRKIKGALVYPAVIVLVAIIASAVLLIFVIPVFAAMFTSFGGELPLPTKIVMGLSDFLRGNFVIIIIVIIAFSVAFNFFKKTPQGTVILDTISLKLPVFGNLIQKTAIARFSRTLATLMSSGVNIISALETTAKTSGNAVVERAIMKSRSSIQEGESISSPLSKEKIFPPMVTQMIKIGEETGGLEEMLIKVAEFYDEEVDAAVDTLMAAMEPIVIVFIGVVIGGMVMAMYLPMFQMITIVM